MKKRLGFDLIILGAPASGKDTQARLLGRKFILKSVESGDYLRGLLKNQTKLGGLLRRNLSKGLPAPSGIIKEFLTANVRLAPKNSDLLFVGNPRLKSEAEFLVKLLQSNKRDYFVVYINLPKEQIWKRSARRLRNADDTKYIATRIKWHTAQVGKTVKYFQKLKKLKFIDGNNPINAVNKEITKALNEYRKSRTN